MTTISCQCGKVRIEATGKPILTGSCYCKDCQAAAHQFEALPCATTILDPDGGTASVLYRKDRIDCLAGAQHMREFRLTAQSPTRRVVATCCNTPMFLDFTKGHWLTLYRKRFAANAPPIELRVMTREAPSDARIPDDVPSYPGRSGLFLRKLVAAWIAMGFRIPVVLMGQPR